MLEGIGMSLPVNSSSSQSLDNSGAGSSQASNGEAQDAESFVEKLKSQLRQAKKPVKSQPTKNESQPTVSAKESSEPFSETEMMAAFNTIGPQVATNEDPLQLEERAFQDPVTEELQVLRVKDNHRKQAMLKFMDSMESELGISPQQMVEAIRGSGTDVQSAPPDQSMGQVLARLDLEPRQIEKAADLYAEMLVETGYGSKAMNQERDFSSSKFSILTRGQVRRHEQSAAVDRLQSRFFDTVRPAQNIAGPQGAKPTPELVNPQNFFSQNGSMVEGQNAQGQNPVVYNRPAVANENALMASLAMMKATSQAEAPAVPREMNFSPSQSGFESQNATTTSFENLLSNSQFGQNSGQQSFDSSSGFNSSSTGMTNTLAQDATEGLGEAEFDEMITRGENINLAQSKADPVAGAKVSMFNNSNMNNVEVENIQEVMDRAQVMIKDGGGAMRVKLNPEGLGEVDLNVDVENGQVNIRMVTEHSEAKRALEKGLDDLRGQLALQKLNVDTVKIDISGELAKHFEENQSEAEQDQAREFARDFMSRNREQGAFSRQDFLGSPFQKYFSQQRGDVDPVQVEEAQATAATSSKSSQLHLVA